jgi:hypothetical protein
MKKLLLVVTVLALASMACADSIVFAKSLGAYKSEGLLDWEAGWTWNGVVQQPPDYVLPLSATINLYAEVNNSHTLFVQVKNVNNFVGNWFGEAFTDITITRLVLSDPALASSNPIYSGQFANPGEYLQGTLGDCSQSQNVSLSSTPGWGMTTMGPGVFSIQTQNIPTNGFTTGFGCIYGTYRIINGGIFALDFGSGPDLKAGDVSISVVYGNDRQTFPAVFQSPVPEPGSLLLFGSGVLGALAIGRRYLGL